MKKFLSAAIIMSALVISSCSKSSGGGGSSTGSFTYRVDGTAVTVDSAKAVLYTLGVAPFNREIDVYAFKGGQQVLEFHFLPKTGAQTVSASFGNAWLTYITNDGLNFPGDYYTGVSGSFNLSICDTTAKKLSGTFAFTGNNGSASKNISEGNLVINTITVQ